MPERALCLLLFCNLAIAACAPIALAPDAPIRCENCAAWNRPQEPFRIYGNSYYVGVAGLSSIVIDTGVGLILLDAGLPQSAARIDANIRKLGFDPRDIQIIAVSHAHFDHVGGVAALQRMSNARVIASYQAVSALQNGGLPEDDPQYVAGFVEDGFPAVSNVTGVDDDWEYRQGSVRLQGIHTPGHTPGGMSWTWQSCEHSRCLNVVYVDSVTAVSAPGYQYSDGLGEALRGSIERIAALDCDILFSTHPSSTGMHALLAQGVDALIDNQACRRYAAQALSGLDLRLASERP